MAMNNSVKINCRKCGQPSESDRFILDPVYKMMVCPRCAQDRKSAASMKRAPSAADTRAALEAKISPSTQKPKEPEKPKPAGWDEDDLELERLAKYKTGESKPRAERISDDKYKVTCAKCKYKFTYNIDNQTPSSCPYCGREVDKSTIR